VVPGRYVFWFFVARARPDHLRLLGGKQAIDCSRKSAKAGAAVGHFFVVLDDSAIRNCSGFAIV
jgi:hypothetical protein